MPADVGETTWGAVFTDASGVGATLGGSFQEYEHYGLISYTPSPIDGGDGILTFGYRLGGEILRPKAPAPARAFRTCVVLDTWSANAGDAKYSAFTLGPGIAVGPNRSVTLFAAPLFGFAGPSGFDDFVTTFLTGVSLRGGSWYGAIDVTLPLSAAEAEAALSFRVGLLRMRKKSNSAKPSAQEAPAASAPAANTPTMPEAVRSPEPQAAAPAGPLAGAKPYTLEDIASMVSNGVSTARILELSRRSCVNFRMNDAAETRLRRIGADPELIEGLRKTCFSAQ